MFDDYSPNSGWRRSVMPSLSPMPQSKGLFQQAQGFLMNNPLMSTVLGGAGSLLSTGLNFLGQHMQNSWNERMWNEMNEYNTPEAQIQRFLEAGINPAAAVASVTGTPNMTTQAQSGSGPQVAGDIGSMMSEATSNLQSNDLMRAQAGEARSAAALQGVQGQQVARETWEMQRTWNMRIDKMLSDNEISFYEAQKMKEFAPYQSMIAQLTADTMDQTWKNLKEEWKVYEAEIRKYNAEADVSRGNVARLSIENEYRKWLTKRMMELGYSEGDPMFSYVMNMADGKVKEANDILNGIEKVNYVGARGTATGSDPINEKLRNEYESAKSADDIVRSCETAYVEYTQIVADMAGDPNVSSDQYLKASMALDSMAKDLREARYKRNGAYNMFETSLEHYEGVRDPNKWYKEDWFRLGEDILKYGSQIYAASQMHRVGSGTGGFSTTTRTNTYDKLSGKPNGYTERTVYGSGELPRK